MKNFILASTFAAASALFLPANPAAAQSCVMSQVEWIAANFCPRGWLPADGRLVDIARNSALFSLLGTNYGGNGRTTFALPDLRGRGPVGVGQGPGLANYSVGQRGGAESVRPRTSQMPDHSHEVQGRVFGYIRAQDGQGNTRDPDGASLAGSPGAVYSSNSGNPVDMRASTVVTSIDLLSNPTGGNDAIQVQDPFLAMTPCVCSSGIYPSRN